MSGVIGTLVGIAVLGAVAYATLQPLFTRRYPRRPSEDAEQGDEHG